MDKPLDLNAMFAIAHAHMLFEIATGVYKPREGEARNRYEAIVSYIKTGQCTEDPEAKKIIAKLLNEQ